MVLDAADAAFGVAATYTAPQPGAAATPITVRAAREDSVDFVNRARLVTEGGRFRVRRSALPAPQAGGVIEIGEARLEIQGAPQLLDTDRLDWTLDCKPVVEAWRRRV